MMITTDHTGFNYQEMADHAKLVFDTRNATAGCVGGNIVVIGQPIRPDVNVVQGVNEVHDMQVHENMRVDQTVDGDEQGLTGQIEADRAPHLKHSHENSGGSHGES
ncbi:hypothetical protein [Paenibacillus sp. 1A_MP2]|uniref:hypothetical protein n=1 Tax=Paenibacillus sp. 1A_MP2 TaxID=3457495 RepID=UPI003FCE8264